jgi:hypothetical protein
MVGVGAPMGAYGELTGEGKEGERCEEAGARLGGGMGRGRAAGGAPGLQPHYCSLFRAEREVEEGKMREKEKKKHKEKRKRKKTKFGKISEI